MNPISTIAVYAPNRLDVPTFKAGFVARQELVDFLLARLREIPARGVADHRLVVGQRGMGKTSLLRRLAIGIAEDADLAARYLPLTFREEQYNVRSLDRFWRNCGDSLAEWCEANGRPEVAARLDVAMRGAAWADPATAADAFLAETEALGRRAVLFVDNLDLILDALPGDQDWALRRTLQAPGGPILYGAAVGYPRQSGDRNAAFYEFFRPHLLEPLSDDELMACLRRLADARGAAGDGVRKILATDRGRLRTLHRLTGGNPRVLTLVYQILEFAGGSTVFADLEALFDQVTPFYKARVEDYKTDLQRAVIDAIALEWDPITSHDLAATTGIEVTTISSQLHRLRNDGLVEEVRTSGARAGYQLIERFFNVWYLMRHGTRQTRQRLYWLTAFLSSFYAPKELRRLWRDRERMEWAPEYREALGAAIERLELLRRLRPREAIGAVGVETIDEVPATAGRINHRMKGALKLAKTALDLVKDGQLEQCIAVLDSLMARLGTEGAHEERLLVATGLFTKGVALGRLGRSEEAIVVLEDIVVRCNSATEPFLRVLVASALVEKGTTLSKLGRSEESIAVCEDVVAGFGAAVDPALREKVALALVEKGTALSRLGRNEEAVVVYEDVVARLDAAAELALRALVARALNKKGIVLGSLGRSEDALAVFEDVLARFGAITDPALHEEIAEALAIKGATLASLGRSEEALAVCDDVVARFGAAVEPTLRELVASVLVIKGVMLGLGAETLAVCDDVVERFGAATEPALRELVAHALLDKGVSLGRLGRSEEEIAVYHDVIARYGTDLAPELRDLVAKARRDLAWCLLDSNRFSEANAARRSIGDLLPQARRLLDAGCDLVADNFGAATLPLDAVLMANEDLSLQDYSHDLLRFLRLAERRGYGEKLIEWFEASGHAVRQAPIHAAFVAFVRGERFLRDVNPEVRAPAEKIYATLSAPRRAAAQAAPSPPAEKKPRRRGRSPRRRMA